LAKESHFEKNKREIPEATEQLLHYFLSPVLSKMLPIDSLSVTEMTNGFLIKLGTKYKNIQKLTQHIP